MEGAGRREGRRMKVTGERRIKSAHLIDESLGRGDVDDRALVTLPENRLHDVVGGVRLAAGRGGDDEGGLPVIHHVEQLPLPQVGVEFVHPANEKSYKCKYFSVQVGV